MYPWRWNGSVTSRATSKYSLTCVNVLLPKHYKLRAGGETEKQVLPDGQLFFRISTAQAYLNDEAPHFVYLRR